MEIKPAIAEYLVEIELKRYTPKTIRSYSTNLHGFERFCASLNVTDLEGKHNRWSSVTPPITSDWAEKGPTSMAC